MSITETEYKVLKLMVAKYEKQIERQNNFQIVSPIVSRKVDDMNISVRLYNCLKNQGIETIDQILEKSVMDFLRIRNFGKMCLYELDEELKELGLELKK
jgi:DNA-directed RNA polymerase subunit alpha